MSHMHKPFKFEVLLAQPLHFCFHSNLLAIFECSLVWCYSHTKEDGGWSSTTKFIAINLWSHWLFNGHVEDGDQVSKPLAVSCYAESNFCVLKIRLNLFANLHQSAWVTAVSGCLLPVDLHKYLTQMLRVLPTTQLQSTHNHQPISPHHKEVAVPFSLWCGWTIK